jgi:hypothetical protein
MADNVTLNTGIGGADLATDDIAGIHHQRVKLVQGADGVSDGDIALANPLPVLDPYAISRGVVAAHTLVHKFGRNTDVDTTASEDVWEAPTVLWVPPTTARLHDLVSTDANDTAAGSGARTIRVFGLDAAGVLLEETVILNGVTPVATANTYTMIYRMLVLTGGTGGENAGTITATAQTDGTITAQINATVSQTNMAIYQIPASTVGYLVSWYFGILGGTNADVDFALMQKSPAADSVWLPVQIHGAQASGTSHVSHDIEYPIAFAAQTLLKVRATTTASNQDVMAGFDLVLAT